MFTQIIGKVKFVQAYVTAARDFNRLDAILSALDKMMTPQQFEQSAFFKSPAVQAFVARPVPPLVIDKVALSKLPEGSLGKSFADFLDAQRIDPKDLDRSFGPGAGERVRQHIRKTHDLWHVLTGFETDVAGELGLQAFYLAQNPGPANPLILSIGFLNALLAAQGDADRRLAAVVRGWLLGKRARLLFGVDWASLWSTPLAEVRARFDLDLDAVDQALPRANIFPTAAQLN